MILVPPGVRILLAARPVDFRKRKMSGYRLRPRTPQPTTRVDFAAAIRILKMNSIGARTGAPHGRFRCVERRSHRPPIRERCS